MVFVCVYLSVCINALHIVSRLFDFLSVNWEMKEASEVTH